MSEPPPKSRLPEIAPDQLSVHQLATLKRLQEGRGRIPTPYKVWLHSPRLAEHLRELGMFLTRETSLTRREAEIVILAAAAHWRSPYVLAVHTREAREAGLADGLIEAIRAGEAAVLELSREQTILELARALQDSQPVSDELFARAVRDLGHTGVAELLALFGYFTSVSLAMKTYQAGTDG